MDRERIAGMSRKALEVLEEELKSWMKDALAPGRLREFVRQMGMDVSSLAGLAGGPAGFNPYMILGLDRSASDEEVKRRYRELLRKLHPDTAGAEGTTLLLGMVLSAYELIKKERRWP